MMTMDLIVKHNESMVRHIEQAIMTSTVVLDVTAGLLLVTNKQQNLNHQLATGQSVTSVNTNELNRARNLINNALQEIEVVSQLNSEVENAIEKD